MMSLYEDLPVLALYPRSFVTVIQERPMIYSRFCQVISKPWHDRGDDFIAGLTRFYCAKHQEMLTATARRQADLEEQLTVVAQVLLLLCDQRCHAIPMPSAINPHLEDKLINIIAPWYKRHLTLWKATGCPRGGAEEQLLNRAAEVLWYLLRRRLLQVAGKQRLTTRNYAGGLEALAFRGYEDIIVMLHNQVLPKDVRNIAAYLKVVADNNLKHVWKEYMRAGLIAVPHQKQMEFLPLLLDLPSEVQAYIFIEHRELVAQILAYWDSTLDSVEREIMRLRWEVDPPTSYARIKRMIPELRDVPENTITAWVSRILRDTRKDLGELW